MDDTARSPRACAPGHTTGGRTKAWLVPPYTRGIVSLLSSQVEGRRLAGGDTGDGDEERGAARIGVTMTALVLRPAAADAAAAPPPPPRPRAGRAAQLPMAARRMVCVRCSPGVVLHAHARGEQLACLSCLVKWHRDRYECPYSPYEKL